jgi:5-methylcytosine-specific restriction endonuclease McrA
MIQRKSNTTCSVCTKSIYRRPSQINNGRVYCSSRCTGLYQQKSKLCKICNKSYLGGKKTCSRACANKARAGIIYTREGRFDKAFQGRMLKKRVAEQCEGVCERCGMDNYAILHIHHKTERYKGGSDQLENLELLCPNCHATHHLGSSLYLTEKML